MALPDPENLSRSEALMLLYELGGTTEDQTSAINEAKEMGVLDQLLKEIDAGDTETEEPGILGQIGMMGAGGPVAAMTPEEMPSRQALPEEKRQRVMDYVRPATQAIGSTVGSIIGGAAGAGGGPTAPATIPAGAVAGGTLGYAMGDQVADIIEFLLGKRDKQPIMVELEDTAKDLIHGATWEMGGAVAGPVLGAAGRGLKKVPGVKTVTENIGALAEKIPPMRVKKIEQRVGEILAANTPSGPIVAKNIDDAKALEELIPGLKFTRVQHTGGPDIKFKDMDIAEEYLERTANNYKALSDYVTKIKGGDAFKDTAKILQAEKELAETGVTTAGKTLEKETERLGSGLEKIEAGKEIRQAAKTAEDVAREKAGKMFEEAPQEYIDADPLISEIKKLSKPMYSMEDLSKNIPEEFSRVKKTLKETHNITTSYDLQGLRSDLTDDLRALKASVPRNRRKEKRLSGLLSAIDELFEESISGQKLKSARTFFKDEVIEKFHVGSVDEILRQGLQGDRVIDAQVVSKFFQKGAMGRAKAEEFLNALGNDKQAMNAFSDAIKQDLLEKVHPVTGELSNVALKRWLKQYNPALKKLGIQDQFNTLSKARDQLDDAIKIQTAFNESQASKMLNADIDNVVKEGFKGTNKRKAAVDIMRRLKGDKKAVAGLQNSMIDHMIDTAKIMDTDYYQNYIIKSSKLDKVMDDYKSALDVVFKDNKEKLNAIKQYQDALRILQKKPNLKINSGLDAVENAISSVGSRIGIGFGRISFVLRTFMNPFKRLSDKDINNLLTRAALDPDLASSLVYAVKKPSKESVDRFITKGLARIGMIEQARYQRSRKLTEEEQQRLK